MRKKVIAGNWKMNKLLSETKSFVADVKQQLSKDISNVEAIICAPFPYLHTLASQMKDLPLHIGAQTMHYEDSGAFTGEVSPMMLKDIGATYVIIGHSERRAYFNETDETVNRKVKAALTHHLTPIVCVGETLNQRESGQTKQHVANQVKAALNGLTNDEISQVMIAYEPIWAIGTGKTASSEEANDVCSHIRDIISQVANENVAEQFIIQYGGSVKPENIEELLNKENVDGALVGGASLSARSFIQLVEAACHG